MVHRLWSTPFIQCLDAVLATVARMLDTSKWCTEHVSVVVINPTHADVDRANSPVGFQLVLGVNDRREAII